MPAGCVRALISNMCQESDSSRRARRGARRGTGGPEATDSHSSPSLLIRGMMGKHVNAEGRKKIIRFAEGRENVPWMSRDASRAFECRCVGCELRAYGDPIQLPPPRPPLPSRPVLPDSPGFHHCLRLYGNKQQRRRQQFLFSLLLIGPWLPTKSTFKLKHTLNNVISNMCYKNKMTGCPNRY